MNDLKLNEVPSAVLSYHERRGYLASGKLELGGFLIALPSVGGGNVWHPARAENSRIEKNSQST